MGMMVETVLLAVSIVFLVLWLTKASDAAGNPANCPIQDGGTTLLTASWVDQYGFSCASLSTWDMSNAVYTYVVEEGVANNIAIYNNTFWAANPPIDYPSMTVYNIPWVQNQTVSSKQRWQFGTEVTQNTGMSEVFTTDSNHSYTFPLTFSYFVNLANTVENFGQVDQMIGCWGTY